MNKIIAFGCIMLGIFSQAQTNRFFYDYRFIPDSGNREDVKNEMMYLDIDKDGSNYYSRDKFISDSTSMAEIAKQVKSSSGNFNINSTRKQGLVSFKVTKSYPNFTTYLYRSISSDHYKIREDQKPEWKILPDKQKIGEYNTQKATTDFGGRQWTAWFSTDIPFQDGPYKFYGLPGLIVKIEDSTGSHVMTLAGNKKIAASAAQEKEPELPQNIRIFGMGGKEVEVTEDQFRKAWKDYVNDPTKNMRQMMMQNTENSKVSFKVKTSDGKEISDPNEVFRSMEKRTKESLAKNNNPIEPDLVK